jgi:Flp pilus assembly protein TadG
MTGLAPGGPARARWRAPLQPAGIALVEFALIAPLLFLLIFGIVDFGRALDYYNQLTQPLGQGARAAAVNRNPDGSALSSSNHFSIQQQLATTYTTQPELEKGSSSASRTCPLD